MGRNTNKIKPEEEFTAIFKNVWFYVVSGVLLLSLAVWIIMPSWEQKNSGEILAYTKRIESLATNDKIAAFQEWQQLSSLIEDQKITNNILKEAIANSQDLIDAIYDEVASQIEELEEQKRLEEQRIASEKQEEERRERLRQKYRKVDQSAIDALNSLKRLAALTEVGVNRLKYQEALGHAWGDIKIFVESPQGKNEYSELSRMFTSAMDSYKRAGYHWEKNHTELLQLAWQSAGRQVKAIDDLINQ